MNTILSPDWFMNKIPSPNWFKHTILSPNWFKHIILSPDWFKHTILSSDWFKHTILCCDCLQSMAHEVTLHVAFVHAFVNPSLLMVLHRGIRQVRSGRRSYFLLVLQTINRRSCRVMEKAPTRAFSWLKALTRAFTFKTLSTRRRPY